jgi:hypothetical protein
MFPNGLINPAIVPTQVITIIVVIITTIIPVIISVGHMGSNLLAQCNNVIIVVNGLVPQLSLTGTEGSYHFGPKACWCGQSSVNKHTLGPFCSPLGILANLELDLSAEWGIASMGWEEVGSKLCLFGLCQIFTTFHNWPWFSQMPRKE